MEAIKIKTINDLVKSHQFDQVEELTKYLHNEIYPVTLKYDDKKITLTTDADRVPFSKVLWFPFTDEDYEDAMVGLQCVTDYAMHEGYDHTHEDLFKELAIHYAEEHGIIEYNVNKEYMEYWSLYEDGFHFYRVDLNSDLKEHLCHIEWHKEEEYPIPAFLLTEVQGFTKYNYFEG